MLLLSADLRDGLSFSGVFSSKERALDALTYFFATKYNLTLHDAQIRTNTLDKGGDLMFVEVRLDQLVVDGQARD